jgi:hypothetical protein
LAASSSKDLLTPRYFLILDDNFHVQINHKIGAIHETSFVHRRSLSLCSRGQFRRREEIREEDYTEGKDKNLGHHGQSGTI